MNKQVAVVTGAAGGFGSAIVKDLLQVGYYVAATDINTDALESISERLKQHERLKTYAMDVTDLRSVAGVGDTIASTISSNITVLVNNAGVVDKNFCLAEDGALVAKRIIDINLTGAFNCTDVFSKHMARIKYGRIVNIASVAGIWGASGGAAYAASKAGLIKASESWARELGPLNISVTAIAPGICKTNMLDRFVSKEAAVHPEEAKIVKSIVPIGRWGTPEDVAEMVTFLCTCKTNYLTATVIAMDGGMRVGTL